MTTQAATISPRVWKPLVENIIVAFMNWLLSSPGPDAFKVKNIEGLQAATNRIPGDFVEHGDALSPTIIGNLIAVAKLFSFIENPDTTRQNIGETYDEYRQTLKIMLSRRESADPYIYPDIPINPQPTMMPIFGGVNLIPQKLLFPITAIQKNSFIDLLLFLHYFVAIHDISTLKSVDVIPFLLKYSSQFVTLISDIMKDLMMIPQIKNTGIHFDIVFRSLQSALPAVVDSIIAQYRKLIDAAAQTQRLRPHAYPAFTAGATGANFTDASTIDAYLKLVNTAIPPAVSTPIATAFKKITDVAICDATAKCDASKLAFTEDEFRRRRVLAMLNHLHVFRDTTAAVNAGLFLEVITEADYQNLVKNPIAQPKAGAGGAGGVTAWGVPIPGGGGSMPSYDFLYGEKFINDATYNLATGVKTAGKAVAAFPLTDTLRSLLSYNVQGVNPADAKATENRPMAYIDENIPKNVGLLIQEVEKLSAGDANLLVANFIATSLYEAAFHNYKLSTDIVATKEASLLGVAGNNMAIYYAKISPILAWLNSARLEDLMDSYLDLLTRELIDNVAPFISPDPKNAGKYVSTFDPITKTYIKQTVAKNDLSNPEIWAIYQSMVRTSPDIYSKLLNLIHTDTSGKVVSDVAFDAAKNLTADVQKKQFRLNVRKAKVSVRQQGGGFLFLNKKVMRGGQPEYYTTMFETFLPVIPLSSITGMVIYVDEAPVFIPVTDPAFQALGTRMLSRIFRTVYYNGTSKTVTIAGQPIDTVQTTGAISRSPPLNPGWIDNFAKSIADKVLGADLLSASWKKSESDLASHLAEQAKYWERRGRLFVRLDDNGNIVEQKTADQCPLTGLNSSECISFINRCVMSPGLNADQICRKLYNAKYTFATSPLTAEQIAREVVNMNPFTAMEILRKFGFSSYLVEEHPNPLPPGFKRYKMQSVGQWIATLNNKADSCKPAGDACAYQRLVRRLGQPTVDKLVRLTSLSRFYPFLTYLDVLVEWVNANPQTLNPEEVKNPVAIPLSHPKAKNLSMYDFVDYNQAAQQAKSISCGLARIQSGLMTGAMGTPAQSLVHSLVHTNYDTIAPFNANAFTYPVLHVNNAIMNGGEMMGGGIESLEHSLRDYHGAFGFNVLKEIYESLKASIQQMEPKTGGRFITISPESERQILNKLNSYRNLEQQLRNMAITLIEKSRLYRASKGHINAFAIPDADLPDVIKKHAKLLNMGQGAYDLNKLQNKLNQKGIYLVNVYKTIADHIADVVTEKLKSTPHGVTSYPVTANYR